MAKLTVEGLDGFIGEDIKYHYDVHNDVMYLRLADKLKVESYGEETDDGLILLRALVGDEVVGITVIAYWTRFGTGRIEDAPISHVAENAQDLAERMLQPAA